MLKYIPLFFICLSCNQQETQAQLEAKCAPALERILNIQDIREAARKDFGITIRYYKAGKVSDTVWKEEQIRWQEYENNLATSANYLYESARVNDCL
jgi:hypothetical protein|tara:strand:+ start:274 stop:564 length:291 start_codon:yes stop_codon:yes gene_type:complete